MSRERLQSAGRFALYTSSYCNTTFQAPNRSVRPIGLHRPSAAQLARVLNLRSQRNAHAGRGEDRDLVFAGKLVSRVKARELKWVFRNLAELLVA